MPIRKRKIKSGISWGYYFDLPGSTREKRNTVYAWGFASKAAAKEAEFARRIEEKRLAEESAARAALAPVAPRSLDDLIAEFCREYADRNLAVKTVARYRELAEYVAPELRAMAMDDVTPLLLTREWNRLRESGGHFRAKKEEARPLSVKTVRNIAGLVSSAYTWALGLGLAKSNPVGASTKPRMGSGGRRQGIALSPEQQAALLESSGHWLAPMLLELCAGLGLRRGEALALRWSDIAGDQARIGRSLSQAGAELGFKEPKTTAGVRIVTMPASTAAELGKWRAKQAVWRAQFGPDYRTDLDLVLCNPDGSPVRPDSISATVSALCRRLKLPRGVSLHTLRHTHGSQLLAAGMDLPAVSARLGHSSPAVTAKVYSHVLDGRDREAARVWDLMQGRPGSEKPKEVN